MFEPPLHLGTLVGRQAERDELTELVRTVRLVTVTGTAGVGKTRVVAEVVRGLGSDFPGGIRWLDLRMDGTPRPVLEQLEAAITSRAAGDVGTVAESPHRGAGGDITARRLLVIDDWELRLGRLSTDLLGRMRTRPGLTVVLVSRASPVVPGEHVYRIDPLPDVPSSPATPVEVRTCDQVRLLLTRASEVGSACTVADDDIEDVRRVTAHLGGLPTAIEIAAQRLGTLSIRRLADRLDTAPMQVLSAERARLGETVAPSLTAMLDATFRTCTYRERLLWVRLCAFSGAADLEGAVAVCSDDELDADELPELLAGLVGKSVLRVVDDDERRYALPAPLRAYGATQWPRFEPGDQVRARHAAHFHARVAPTAGSWTEATSGRLVHDQHDLEAALVTGSQVVGIDDGGADVAVSLGLRWIHTARIADGAALLERTLGATLAGDGVTSGAYARVRCVQACLAMLDGDRAGAQRLAELAEPADAPDAAALAGVLACALAPEPAAAPADGPETDPAGGTPEELSAGAARALRHAATMPAGSGLELYLALTLLWCAVRRAAQGHRAEAGALRVAAQERVGDSPAGIAYLDWASGVQSWLYGDVTSAVAAGEEMLRRSRSANDVYGTVLGLTLLAHCAADRGDGDGAATMLGAVCAVLPDPAMAQRLGWELDTSAWGRRAGSDEPKHAHGPRTLPEPAPRVSVDGVIDALIGGREPEGRGPGDRLTDRETEIAELVVAGHPTRVIAQKLSISPRTVDTHVENILDKLELTSRRDVGRALRPAPLPARMASDGGDTLS